MIILIGLLAAAAIPSMTDAQFGRLAYDDAAAVAELFRAARAQAMALGPIAISMTSSNAPVGGNRGTFQLFTASQLVATPQFPIGTPMTTCSPPTVWPGMSGAANATMIGGVNLNGKLDNQAGVYTVITDPNGPASAAWACFTPLGRMYYSSTVVPNFVASSPWLQSFNVDVHRANSSNVAIGLTRSVIIPPSGAARIFSH